MTLDPRKIRCAYRLFALAATVAGALLLTACGSQPLSPWHTADLGEEFTARDADDTPTFEAYLALEERLFAELEEEVYAEVETGAEFALVRYSKGSLADPRTRQPNWNRSFELSTPEPRGGVLLLHGMSDSPYSLRQLGLTLRAQGFWVIGIRLPGHGTAPSGLRKARWEDMAAAGRLAMQRLVAKVGERPIHVIGYSTGAALALNQTLNALDDPSVHKPASLILISPAIGVARVAALAGPAASLGQVPGLRGLSYTQIVPEFDPYKYNSFTANAGAQVHRLTRSVGDRIGRLARAGRGKEIPPILVFKSTVDATVSNDAVVDRLLGRLPENGHELVLFDINRAAAISALLVKDPGPFTRRLLGDNSLPFALRLIGNENDGSRAVVSRFKPPFSAAAASVEDLDMAWPSGVISLSHIALPFPPDDPLYGVKRPEDPNRLFLGQAEIRGERGLFLLSSDWLLRLRYNPFYALLEQRVVEWIGGFEQPPG